jgi:hypothetical protein
VDAIDTGNAETVNTADAGSALKTHAAAQAADPDE